MGTTQVKLLKAPPQSFVLLSAHFRKTHSHLADTEEQAQQLFLRLVKQYTENEGVTEQLKATDQMKWVQKMNNIRSKTTEIVNAEITFV